jgi:hypothetical protein
MILTKHYIMNNMKKTGNPSWVIMDCPNPSCPNPKNHFAYNLATGYYHCFRCLIKGTFHLDGIKTKIKKEEKVIFRGILPEGCFPLGSGSGYIEKKAMKYLYLRGFVDDDFRDYHIHYAAFGPLAERVVFPLIIKNKIVYYCARDITNESEKRYLNPKGAKQVFNIEKASKFSEVVITEGVIDAIMTGWDAISFLGKTVNEDQLNLLKKYKIRDVDKKKNISLKKEDQLQDSFKLARRLEPYVRTIKIIVLNIGDPGSLRLRERSYINSWKGLFEEIKYSDSSVIKNINISRRLFDNEDFDS